VAQVGGVLALSLRGADAEEVDAGAGGARDVGRELQRAAGDLLVQELGQAGLEERRARVHERRDLVDVDVDADDVVAEGRHAGCVHRTEVPAPDDGDPHHGPLVKTIWVTAHATPGARVAGRARRVKYPTWGTLRRDWVGPPDLAGPQLGWTSVRLRALAGRGVVRSGERVRAGGGGHAVTPQPRAPREKQDAGHAAHLSRPRITRHGAPALGRRDGRSGGRRSRACRD